MSFTEDMQQLDAIARALESGELSVEESLARFEDGVKLIRSCKDYLEKTKRRVTKLSSVGPSEGAAEQ